MKYNSSVRTILGFLLFGLFFLIPNLSGAEIPSPPEVFKKFGILPLGQEEPPEFRLPKLNGETISLSDLRGKAVFLNMMTVGCEPCQKEMPAMEQLHRQYQDKGLVVLGVFTDITPDNADAMKSYFSKQGLTFPVLLLNGGSVKGFTLGWTPVTFLVDKSGRLAGKAFGYKNWTSPEAKEVIDHLLAES